MIFEKDLQHNIVKSCKYLSYAHFNKGEIILDTSVYTGRGGVILKGTAYVKYVDANGRETISDILREGDTFGEFYAAPLDDIVYQVTSYEECEVYFINMGKILAGCSASCAHHKELMQDLFLSSVQYARRHNMQSMILSQRTIRDKITMYLRFQEFIVPKGEKFEIPISLKDLAAYLGVDRSAMMREIRKMNEDMLIESTGRSFRILR